MNPSSSDRGPSVKNVLDGILNRAIDRLIETEAANRLAAERGPKTYTVQAHQIVKGDIIQERLHDGPHRYLVDSIEKPCTRNCVHVVIKGRPTWCYNRGDAVTLTVPTEIPPCPAPPKLVKPRDGKVASRSKGRAAVRST